MSAAFVLGKAERFGASRVSPTQSATICWMLEPLNFAKDGPDLAGLLARKSGNKVEVVGCPRNSHLDVTVKLLF